MLYEAFPMSFLVEQVSIFPLLRHSGQPNRTQPNGQAGGVATTGTQRILDVMPKNIHGRCPVFLGSKDDVEDLKKFYDQWDGEKRW